jgi:hypothetical protein
MLPRRLWLWIGLGLVLLAAFHDHRVGAHVGLHVRRRA